FPPRVRVRSPLHPSRPVSHRLVPRDAPFVTDNRRPTCKSPNNRHCVPIGSALTFQQRNRSEHAQMASVAALIDRGLARVQGSIIVRQGVVVFAASMILNLGGFIFHAVASRRIGVVDYGVLYALIS